MRLRYTTYEAKARFSELLRHVRAGRTVTISYHGKPVAEVRPLESAPTGLEARLADLESRGLLSSSSGPRWGLQVRCEATWRVGAIPGRARLMSVAYVDTSLLVSIAFGEPGAESSVRRLNEQDRLVSSILLEAEMRATFRRQGIKYRPEVTNGITWVHPDRPVSAELAAALEFGHLRGADLLHVATALYTVGSNLLKAASDLTFLTLDARQRSTAAALGFRT